MTESIRVQPDQDCCTACGRSETHRNQCRLCGGSDTLDAYREENEKLKKRAKKLTGIILALQEEEVIEIDENGLVNPPGAQIIRDPK